MGRDSFSFKRFTIRHDRCGQKVGTDGVLLGAWAKGGKRILDIGTGSGLIALMMAQRYPEADIVGIEIDIDAYGQAVENVEASGMGGRISLYPSSLQSFAPSQKFDSIVSNPPFFSESLKAPDSKRNCARHTDSLSFEELILYTTGLMDENACLSVVMPTDRVDTFLSTALLKGLRLSRRCDVKTVERKMPKRSLLELTNRHDISFEHETQVLDEGNGSRSAWYQQLTDDFYL